MKTARKPVFSCTVSEKEAMDLDMFALDKGVDRAKLTRNALEAYTGINLSGTRHRALADDANLPESAKEFIKSNIKRIDPNYLMRKHKINSRILAAACREHKD